MHGKYALVPICTVIFVICVSSKYGPMYKTSSRFECSSWLCEPSLTADKDDTIAAVFDSSIRGNDNDDGNGDELIIDDNRCGLFGSVTSIGVDDPGMVVEVDNKFINRWLLVVVVAAVDVTELVEDVVVVLVVVSIIVFGTCLTVADVDNNSCIDNGSVSCFASISACVMASNKKW